MNNNIIIIVFISGSLAHKSKIEHKRTDIHTHTPTQGV